MKHLVKFSISLIGDQRDKHKPAKGRMNVTVHSTSGTAGAMDSELYLVRYMKKRNETKLFFKHEQLEPVDFNPNEECLTTTTNATHVLTQKRYTKA